MKTRIFTLLLLCTAGAVFGCTDAGMFSKQKGQSTDAGIRFDTLAVSPKLTIAPQLDNHCKSEEVFRITLPVVANNLAYGVHSFAFRYKAPSEPGAPVIVYLPGGPGSSSMDDVPDFLPNGWGYLLTDPRGVGCNTLQDLPDARLSSAFFQTSEFAEDVISAVQNRGLENYILYGISYGTVLATAVAHKIEMRKVSPPKAVVLEGVLGKSFAGVFSSAEYIHQWEKIRGMLQSDVLLELDTSPKPYGLSPEEWGRALGGTLPLSPKLVTDLFSLLSTKTPEHLRESPLTFFKNTADTPQLTMPGEVELFKQVACREIADTVPENDMDVVFVGGQLLRNSAQEGTKCKGIKLINPFDSAKSQFGAKVYYFIGEEDVATPAWQGEYHFLNHQGPAVRVLTLAGGHNSLQFELGACAKDLMKSIDQGGESFSSVLASCPAKVVVDKK